MIWGVLRAFVMASGSQKHGRYTQLVMPGSTFLEACSGRSRKEPAVTTTWLTWQFRPTAMLGVGNQGLEPAASQRKCLRHSRKLWATASAASALSLPKEELSAVLDGFESVGSGCLGKFML